jgi:hypothetical protein
MGTMPNAMGVVGNRRSTEDFEFGDVLGEGSYSTVSGLLQRDHPLRTCVTKTDDCGCVRMASSSHR